MERRLIIDPFGERQLSRCPDCDQWTRQIWGTIDSDTDGQVAAYAVYYMRWTDGRPDHGITAALSLGGWGESSRHKICIGLQGVIDASGTRYRFVDAQTLPWASNTELLGEMLEAHEVTSGPLSAEALGIIGALERSDPRFQKFISGGA